MKFPIGIIAALFLIPVTSFAANWQFTTESGTGDVFQMDFDSIAPVGSYRKTWVQVIYQAEMESKGYPKKKYQTSRMLYYFDCQKKMSTVVHMVNYLGKYAKGEVVESNSGKFDVADLKDIVPDTVGETLLQTACATDKARAKIVAENAETLKKLTAQLKEFEDRMATEAARQTTKDETVTSDL